MRKWVEQGRPALTAGWTAGQWVFTFVLVLSLYRDFVISYSEGFCRFSAETSDPRSSVRRLLLNECYGTVPLQRGTQNPCQGHYGSTC